MSLSQPPGTLTALAGTLLLANSLLPYDYGYFAFVYDKNKLANPPKSLKELVEGPQKWRVIYEDPRTSTPGLGLLLWMQKVYGDQAPEAWQKLAAKTVTVTKGWSEAYGLFLKGESVSGSSVD